MTMQQILALIVGAMTVVACHKGTATDATDWLQSQCTVDPERQKLYIEWMREHGPNTNRQSFQLDRENAVFRVSPQYFASSRDNIVAIYMSELPLRSDRFLLEVVAKDGSRLRLGTIDKECASIVESYLSSHTLG